MISGEVVTPDGPLGSASGGDLKPTAQRRNRRRCTFILFSGPCWFHLWCLIWTNFELVGACIAFSGAEKVTPANRLIARWLILLVGRRAVMVPLAVIRVCWISRDGGSGPSGEWRIWGRTSTAW
ncbi:unnamed protein product [Victoria cruziana]